MIMALPSRAAFKFARAFGDLALQLSGRGGRARLDELLDYAP
jgi:hypothetical protein